MKIKTLQTEACSYLTKIDNKNFALECCEDDQCLSPMAIKVNEDTPCISEMITEGQQFFFSLFSYARKRESGYLNGIGVFNGKTFTVVEFFNSDFWDDTPDQSYMLYGFHPPTNEVFSRHKNAVLTSDGLTILEKDHFLANVGGAIEECSPKDALNILSKYKTPASPSFSRLKLAPSPSRPKNPGKGSVIFNDNTGKLEIFTGKEWKTINYED